jgi:DNA-binding CsgD family transcriptional regulator
MRSSEGVGNILIVEGPAGIGKTELLRRATASAGVRGSAVLAARGGPLERDFPFGIVRQLLERTVAGSRVRFDGVAAQALAALQLRPPAAFGPAIDPATSEGADAIIHGLYWVIATLSERNPLLVLVDDVHWSDGPSLRLIHYLARRVEDLPVTVALGIRTGEGEGHESELSELIAFPGSDVIAPAPLSGRGSAELVHRGLSDAAVPEFCEACHVASAGNPFLLTGLITQLRHSGVEPVATNAARVAALRPASVARAVLANVAHLGRPAGALSEALAVLGTGTQLRWASLLAQLDPDSAAAAADALVGADLVTYGSSLEFTHPLVRGTIYDGIPAARRRLLHARAAELLRDEDADADRVAAQLLLADPAGDQAAVGSLRDAAENAERRGAPDVAAKYLARALQEPPPTAERATIMRSLGLARMRAGEPAGLDDLILAREQDPRPRARAELALEVGRAMMMVDRSTEALDLFAAARAELGDDDGDLGALLEAEEVGAALLDESTAPRAWVEVRDLAGETVGERLLLAYGAYLEAARGTPAAEVASMAGRALASGDLAGEKTVAAFCFAAGALCFSDHMKEARAALDRAIASAREHGSTFTFALASWMRSHVHYRCGELLDAEADAQGALDASSEGWFTAPVGFLADVLIERGELEAADAAFVSYGLTDVLFPNLLLGNVLLDSRGRLRCAQGRYEEGLEDLLAVGERLRAWETVNPAVIAWRSSAALAYAALGDREAARTLSGDELELARSFGAPRALGIALRAAGLVREGAVGIEMLRQAVSVLEHSPARLDHAKALTELGAMLRRSGHRSAARDVLREGLDLADRCGARALANRARQELVTAGARPRRERISGAESLTASEQRIAALAATGMTNREIAQALFITIKTVKAHLGHVFQKLGVRTRAELADALSGAAKDAA